MKGQKKEIVLRKCSNCGTFKSIDKPKHDPNNDDDDDDNDENILVNLQFFLIHPCFESIFKIIFERIFSKNTSNIYIFDSCYLALTFISLDLYVIDGTPF